MRHFPIFLETRGRRIVVAGAGETALAKLRLIAKSEAAIVVIGPEACAGVRALAEAGRIALAERRAEAADLAGAALVYAAADDDVEDTRVRDLARAAGIPANVVDDLAASDFITPAMVDRDPVTVAIGTEGTAPVLARRIKAELEERLSPQLGLLARTAARFRPRAAAIPPGGARRAFWARVFGPAGERA
ncbi:MAG: uroporphyrinogen-III C-methyltransferase, partial [Alphaproteobacteria bacterium]|nr:uroporphyrinogen-III C-methyltransferase [Alphaproteobacteria bacterium]